MSEIQDIIYKYLRNTASESEITELERWVRKSPENAAIFKGYVQEFELNVSSKGSFKSKQAYREFTRKTAIEKKPVFTQKRIVMAATIAIIIGLGILNKVTQNTTKSIPDKVNNVVNDAILLTLEDGTQTVLNENKASIIRVTKGDTLKQYKNNKLIYTKTTLANTETRFHKLEIPLGKTFKIKLSDGTMVWLNAGSSLRFPIQFHEKLIFREVELVGEAFFQVAKNTEQPFLVKTSGVVVKVLGTAFNISSYGDEENIKTTLVEGSVNITDKSNKSNQTIIKPNQQCVFAKASGKLTNKVVDVEKYIAWIDNRLLFENDPFHEIIKKIERSYNVEITCENFALNNTRFTGEFDIEDVNEVLATFNASTPFHYKIKNNQIIISK